LNHGSDGTVDAGVLNFRPEHKKSVKEVVFSFAAFFSYIKKIAYLSPEKYSSTVLSQPASSWLDKNA
jgi:hypothetical protein